MRRLVLLMIGAILAGSVTLLVPGTAAACSCTNEPFSAQQARADIIFTGTPTAADVPLPVDGLQSSDAPVHWSFSVDAVHRGPVTATVEVDSALSEASCGIALRAGRPYLVLGTIADGRISTHLCSGTAPLAAVAATDLAALGPAEPPADDMQSVFDARAATERAQEDADSGSWTGPRIAVVAALVAAVLGSGVLALNRRSRREP
ncbi:hypothetical protein JL107_01285 [Nakamurella flavida]|uniref:Tissue inhibitor of metalloproteinase n=1 Tax=Nakamurella flavida TaxID=363630 RepID=A0A938YHY1_9ACTN|nr:hypothetical protein [Nakamurella flavida]MBM9475068.1 hypothetical protein [Nakamurella flavida]MDP9776637.1 hypothetical protein [Nakamurella flavida]